MDLSVIIDFQGVVLIKSVKLNEEKLYNMRKIKVETNIILENIDTKGEKREYKIYDYFKEQPTFLVSIISAMVIVVSFILNSALYASTCTYLNNWGFDSHSMNINTTGKTLIFAVESIGFFSTCFLQQVLKATYIQYLHDIEESVKIGILCDEIKKNIKGKNIVKSKEKKRIIVNVFNKDRELLEEENAIEYLKNMKKKMKKEPKKKLQQTLIIVCFFMLLLWIPMLIMIEPTVYIFVVILFAGLVTVIYTVLAYIKDYLIKKCKRKRLIKEEIEKREEPIAVFLNEKEKQEVEYPLDKVAKLKFKEFFHDEGIASLSVFAITCIAILFVWLYSIGNIQNDNLYPITSIDETTYVILYENDDYYYLEKAEICEDTLQVEISIQRVIKKDDIEYEIKKFENVKKLRADME